MRRELDTAEVAQQTLPHVVFIKVPGGTGSGFFIAPDLVVTCFHVVRGAADVELKGNGWSGRAVSVVAWSEEDDLAILRVSPGRTTSGLKVAQGAVPVGMRLVVVSAPLGLQNTVTDGLLSAVRDDLARLQVSAPISPGSSGGPIVDAHGEVVGVVSATLTTLEGGRTLGQNLNFAVPAQRIVEVLRAQRETPVRAFAELSLPAEERQWRELEASFEQVARALPNELGVRLARVYVVAFREALSHRDEQRVKQLIELRETLKADRATLMQLAEALFQTGGQGPALAKELVVAWETYFTDPTPAHEARLEAAKQRAKAHFEEVQRNLARPAFPDGFAGFPFMASVSNVYGYCHPGYVASPMPGLAHVDCPRVPVRPPFAQGEALLVFLNGSLVEVQMGVSSYQLAVEQITSKYGPPIFVSKQGDELTQVDAPTFGPNTFCYWALRGGSIIVGRETDEPFVTFRRAERDQAIRDSF